MRKVAWLLLLLLGVCGCENRGYDTGDGTLSYMRADFCDMTVSPQGSVSCVVTDDGDTLHFSKDFNVGGTQKSDTTIRALVYYNRYDDGRACELLRAVAVPVVRYSLNDFVSYLSTDPVGFERLWLSRNGNYINFGLLLKTGQPDSVDKKQALGLLCDSVKKRADGTKCYYLHLYHAQNGVPEYYSSRAFISLPVAGSATGDEYHFSINTYKGVIEKSIIISSGI